MDSRISLRGNALHGRGRAAWRWLAGLFLATAALPALAALVVTVTMAPGAPDPIYPGQATALRITLANSGVAALTGVNFINSLPGALPNGLRIVGAPTYSCTDPVNNAFAVTGTVTANVGSQAISLAGGTIPAHDNVSSTDGVCTIDLPVTAGTSTGAATSYAYTIGATTVGSDQAIQNVGAATQNVHISAFNKPTITKVFGASTLFVGGSATTLTITVANNNPFALSGFSIRDIFPVDGSNVAYLRVAPTPATTLTCTAGGSAPTLNLVSAGDVSISTAADGTVAANGSCTLTVQVEAAQSGIVYSLSTTNTIRKSLDFVNDIGIAAATDATASVTLTSPLRVSKSFNSTLASGQSDILTIFITNDVTGLVLTVDSFADDAIDGSAPGNLNAYGLKVSGAITSTNCGAAAFIATANNTGVKLDPLTTATITHGTPCTIRVPFTGTAQTHDLPSSFTNIIPAGAAHTTLPGIVSSATQATILVADMLHVTKSALPSSAAPGNPVQYTVAVNNYSAGALNNVTVTDGLPAGMTALSGGVFQATYTCSGSAIVHNVTPGGSPTVPTFLVTQVPARSSPNTPGLCTLVFWAMVDKTATNTPAFHNTTANTITAGQVCDDLSVNCNGAPTTPTNGTVTNAVLSATKAFSPAGPLQEGTVTRLTITLVNNSANPLTAASLVDNLPLLGSGAQMILANSPNASSNCGSPSITATPGATSVSMSGATIPARGNNGLGTAGSCVLAVDVVGPAGVYTNTINTTDVAATETWADGNTHIVNLVANAPANLTYTSVLSGAKSFSPTTVSSGGRSTVRVTVSNSGVAPLTGVAVTDYFTNTGLVGGASIGMVLANPPNAYSTCDGNPAFGATAGANHISMIGASVPGGGNCDFLFDVVATGAGWTNTIPPGNVTANGGVRNQSAISAPLAFSAATDITVTKNTAPSGLTFPGQVSQLTITLINGATAVTDLQVTDYFTTTGLAGAPANGWLVAAAPMASTTCPGGVVSAAPAGTSVSISGISLAAGGSCVVTLNVTSLSVGSINNIIPANAVITAQGLSNSQPAITSLGIATNIGVAKQFTPTVVKPGQTSRLRITFYNPRDLVVAGLAVTDTLPAGVTVSPSPNPSTTCTGATVTGPDSGHVKVTGGGLPVAVGGVASSCYAEIDVFVAAQGDYTNTIPVGGVTATVGGQPASNGQPASAILRARMPMSILKSFANATRKPGQATTMTITLVNPNPVSLTQAAFTDSLPAGLVVALTPNVTGTCKTVGGGVINASVSGTTVRLAGATVPANGNCTVLVDVLSNITGTYTNTIPAGGVTTFEGVTNENPVSATVVVTNPPTVSKQFTPGVIPAGGTSTLTISLGNLNASPMTLTANFDDVLPTVPGQISVANPANLATTCGGTAPVAAPGATSVRLPINATIPAGGCTITVNVTGSVPGNHINSIPAAALQTNFGNNPDPANATLVISTQGYISGKVFKDNNPTPNGAFDPVALVPGQQADTPIAGVSIELRSGANCSGALVVIAGVSNPATTDSQGNYLFYNLPAGTYSVCEPTQPTGTVNGTTSAGTIASVSGSTGTPGVASNPGNPTSQVIGIVLNGDGAGGAISGSPNNNFAEIATSTVSGTVFLDPNNNGVQDAGDTAINNVRIELHSAADCLPASLLQFTNTNPSGVYSFSGLAPGTYTVCEPTQPAGTANGKTVPGAVGNGGTAGTASLQTEVPSLIKSLVLPPNTVSSGNNFAELSATGSGLISGYVYVDALVAGARNGLRDVGVDGAIPGVTMTLSGTDASGNAINLSVVTDINGLYSFGNLPPSDATGYTITEIQPKDYTDSVVNAPSGNVLPPANKPVAIGGADTITGVTVTAGQIRTDYNFAEIMTTPVGLLSPIVNGFVYFDPSHTRNRLDPTAVPKAGWTVVLYDKTNTAICSAITDSNGFYQFDNLRCNGQGDDAGKPDLTTGLLRGLPNDTGFSIKFSYQGSGLPNKTQSANGAGTEGSGQITGISLSGSQIVPEQNLPLDPSGVIYDATSGKAVGGAVVSFQFNGVPVALNCLFGNPNPQTTAANGFYQFQLVSPAPAGCPGTGTYTLAVTPPSGYQASPSTLIPACAGSLNLGANGSAWLVRSQNPVDGANYLAAQLASSVPGACPATAAGLAAGQGSSQYYLSFFIDLALPSADAVNNHIPLDPLNASAILMTKVTPLVNVARGDLVPYTITATNTTATNYNVLNIQDLMPPGFKYRTGSSRVIDNIHPNGIALEPTVVGSQLTWADAEVRGFDPKEKKTFKMILMVGSGVGDGTYTNQTWAEYSGKRSNVATASVRVVPDPTFDCPDVIGKVFDDKNANGYQDQGEPGIPNVRLATLRGLLVTTDANGRFHVPCPEIPNQDRGSNFVMKLDDRTLPSGYRLTTENPRDVRITRGKLVKLNFGATIHRVVRIELTDAAFEAGKDVLLPDWQKKIEALPRQLTDKPSLIRLAYLQGADPGLLKKRVKALKEQIEKRWQALNCCYRLVIETEGEGAQ